MKKNENLFYANIAQIKFLFFLLFFLAFTGCATMQTQPMKSKSPTHPFFTSTPPEVVPQIHVKDTIPPFQGITEGYIKKGMTQEQVLKIIGYPDLYFYDLNSYKNVILEYLYIIEKIDSTYIYFVLYFKDGLLEDFIGFTSDISPDNLNPLRHPLSDKNEIFK